ncbi:arsenate reductase (glutaredoxin) [Thalassotalea piscium]|uniref:Arsenate reductase n=1 Tax=Thalassotalea piscium TaxID=1230533 RepID=A0A7X0NFH4_9GAMM|nr:arsenate reductase (glutaredoxin) [Thalassotalea piscium]MBB6542484.1 arsenate reductase [Thalassotalea piscium]
MYTIYHNPRCSKSRQTLALLEENNVDITVVEYLKNPLTAPEILSLLAKLNKTPIEIMRVKESEFSEQNLKGASDETLINAMVNTPKLIERPIVVKDNAAIIGRPPENVLTLIN